MARSSFLFTSESVSEGHPDKVADQISDAVVDLFLSKDPEARVACETLTTTNLVVLAGEIRGKGIMFGYASNETPELMPATLQYSHNILRALAAARHSGKEPKLEPDAKSQVTLFYQDGKPVRATSIVLGRQHGSRPPARVCRPGRTG